MKTALARAARRAGRAVSGILPVAVLARLGLPALAAAVFLAVLVLGAACWVIGSDGQTDRVNRMLLACRGNAHCLKAATSAPRPPSRQRRLSGITERYRR